MLFFLAKNKDSFPDFPLSIRRLFVCHLTVTKKCKRAKTISFQALRPLPTFLFYHPISAPFTRLLRIWNSASLNGAC